MNLRLITILLLVGALGFAAWQSQLFQVERRGTTPRPLVLIPAASRRAASFDRTLAAVPIGTQRLAAGEGVILVHYWAPWEHNSGAQALGLDSLRRTLPPGAVTTALVCLDPFPSVARYAARMRLRMPILLDLRHSLADQLAAPRIPYTYLIDARGRIAAEQDGEVDWLAPASRAALTQILAEPAASPQRMEM